MNNDINLFYSQQEVWAYITAGGKIRPKSWDKGHLQFVNGYLKNHLGQKASWTLEDPDEFIALDFD